MEQPFSWTGTGKSAKLIFSGQPVAEPDSTLTNPEPGEASSSAMTE